MYLPFFSINERSLRVKFSTEKLNNAPNPLISSSFKLNFFPMFSIKLRFLINSLNSKLFMFIAEAKFIPFILNENCSALISSNHSFSLKIEKSNFPSSKFFNNLLKTFLLKPLIEIFLKFINSLLSFIEKSASINLSPLENFIFLISIPGISIIILTRSF